MTLTNFIDQFASQFENTEVAEFNASTEFKQLEEWSSLTALSIIAMVFVEYKVKLKGDDIRTSDTIEDLYNIVKKQF